MTTDPRHRRPSTTVADASTPVLLLAALAAMFPVVIGIVTVSRSDSVLALVVAIAVLLLGMVVVTTTITRQLSNVGGDTAPPPVADGHREDDSSEPRPDGSGASGPTGHARRGSA